MHPKFREATDAVKRVKRGSMRNNFPSWNGPMRVRNKIREELEDVEDEEELEDENVQWRLQDFEHTFLRLMQPVYYR